MIERIGRFGHFLADLARAVPDVATWGRLTPVQMRRIGVDSLPVALFIAAFTGVVLALQASYTFTGAVPLYFVGTLVGKTMMLELGLVQTAFDSQAVSDLRRSIRDFSQIADRLVRVTDEQADVIGSVGTNLRKGSDYLAQAATDLQATLGRVDSATNQGQLSTILDNSAVASQDIRAASADFRELLDAAHKNQESLVRVLVAADSVMARIANRGGTLGLLVADSALYRETTLTMIQLQQLLSDIQANPRKYFTFSVF